VNAEPHGELHRVRSHQTGVQGGDGLDEAQARVHRTPGIIFMGCGVAKINQQAIAEILGDMARVLLDDRGGGLLVGAHYHTQVFRVELARELRRAHQVAEEHGELPSFRLGGRLRSAVISDGSLGLVKRSLLGLRPWYRGQWRSAAIAELASVLDLPATTRAHDTEQCAAFATKSCLLTVVCLAPRTLHVSCAFLASSPHRGVCRA